MKNRIIALLWTLAALSAPGLSAQDYVATPVQVSQEKVRLNGKVYLSHAVKERQTLFGIAKAYGVTVDDLYEANPELRENGLKTDTTILVPLAAGTSPVVETQEPVKVQEAQESRFIEHTVMWYEDLDDIAAEYGVTPQEIIDANKLRGRKVNKRQVLKIPVKGKDVAANTAAAAEPRKEVAVAPPDIPTISDPEIKDPELASTGTYKPIPVEKLKVDKAKEKEVLPPDIPTISDPEIKDPEMVATGTYNPIEVNPLKVDPAKALEGKEDASADAEEFKEDPGLFNWFAGKGTVQMALLLPFNSNSNSFTESNMDFYSGVLMALRDLEAQGVKTHLNVYDFQAGVPSARELSGNDFILGPVSSRDLATVLETVGGKVPVVSPLDQRAISLADSFAGFIQAPASAENQYSDLASWAAQEAGRRDRIILVTEKVSGSSAPAAGVRNALVNGGVSFESVSYTLSEGRSLPASLTARLTKEGVNRIIVASEKEAFIGDAVRNLGILRSRGYEVVMYAPSRVRTFDTIDGADYHQNSLHISSAYFVDYDDPRVKSFVRAYRALYRTEPTQFAFQGYDTARYFALMCAKYGNRWTAALGREDAAGLHTDFHFIGNGHGSFKNTAVRRIVYNADYSTELAK